MKFNLSTLKERGIRVVSNAGGINPHACAKALLELAAQLGVSVKVAVVDGDDVLPNMPALREQGVGDFYTSAAMPAKLVSANAYLGAFPIAKALDEGADIVITGRTVDSALVLGVLIHEYGWQRRDYDLLAAGSLAGHIIECGCQATGGLHTDWELVPGWAQMGYPVIDVAADGSFSVSKPEGTGGLVNTAVISEQLLYEIGDPGAYALPDVICDFTQVRVEQLSNNVVSVRGAKGHAPGPQYKVSATYVDGYRCIACLTIIGFDAASKAQRTGEAILERTRGLFARLGLPDYSATRIDVLGLEGDYGAAAIHHPLREAVLRLVVSHPVKMALDIFSTEIAPAGTSYAPGTTGSFGIGRPKASPQVKLFSCLIPKSAVTPVVTMGEVSWTCPDEFMAETADTDFEQAPGAHVIQEVPAVKLGKTQGQLIDLAYARSGDKGDTSNIGIIARRAEWLDAIKAQVTPETVKAYLSHLVKGSVTVYDVPGIHAINVLMTQALDGGGMSSMRNDPLGKGMAQVLLSMPVYLPKGFNE